MKLLYFFCYWLLAIGCYFLNTNYTNLTNLIYIDDNLKIALLVNKG